MTKDEQAAADKAAAEKKAGDKASRTSRTVSLVAASDIRYNEDVTQPGGRKTIKRMRVKAGESVADLSDEAYEQAEAAGQITDAKSFKEAQEKQAKDAGKVEA